MVKTKKTTKPVSKKSKSRPNNPKPKRRAPRQRASVMVNANFNEAKRYMDPEGKTDAPATTSSLGNFTTVNSIVRQVFLTSGTANTDFYVVVQWCPSKYRLAYWSGVSGTPTVSSGWLPTLESNAPTTVKPLRMSVTLRNTAVVTSTEGAIRVLCMPQSIDWSAAFATSSTLTDAFCASIDAMIEGNNKTVTYTAWEMKHGKKWVFAPVSNVGYHTWYEYTSAPSLQNTLVAGSIGDALTTMIIKMPYVANRNSYDITIRSQDGARYPANHVLAQTAKSAQTSKPGVMERIHDIASETSHIAEDIGHVFSSIGNAVPQIAQGAYNLFRTGQAARSLFSSAAPMITEAAEAAPLLLL